MKKAVAARCTLVGGLLLTFVLSGFAPDIARAQAIPNAAGVSTSSITPEKEKKLSQALEQGAKAVADCRFDQAVSWYKVALQLEPARDDISQSLANVLRMREQQAIKLKEMPADAKAREQFLAKSYEGAENYFKEKKYAQAYQAFSDIMLVAGDYKGKTARRATEAKTLMGSQPPAPAVAVTLPAPVAAVAVAKPVVTEVKLDAPVPVAAAVAVPVAAVQIKPIEAVADEQPVASVAVKTVADAETIDDMTRLQVSTMIHTAKEEIQAGKVEEARKVLIQALERWPGNSDAKALLADLAKQSSGAAPAPLAADAVESTLSEGDALCAAGKFDEAIAKFDKVLEVSPNNQEAADRKAKALKLMGKVDDFNEIKDNADKRTQVDQLHTQALKAYEAKDLKKAREIWMRILAADPKNKAAQVYVNETKAAWERMTADEAARDKAEKLSEQDEKLLNSLVSISTDRRIPLDEFMKLLSIGTAVEMEYYITEGAKAQVSGTFQNKPLRDVLDTMLIPIGLSWSIDRQHVIVIDQKLITKTYTLAPAQMGKVKSLYASGELQKTVWGQADPPSQGCAITLDERQNMMVATGSKMHIQKIESLLPALKEAEGQELIVRIYKINEKDGPRIKSLINSIITATQGAPFDLERKIFVDKDDLIVRDTPDNIKKIEELLLDKKFIQDMRDDKIDIANFSLVPRDTEAISDQVRAFTSRVVEAVKVFLYSQTGESKAAEEGRRYWYDPYTLQLTIVDTPTNLARVSQYIEALPELGLKTRQEVIFLKFAVAQQMVGSLQNILQLTNGGTGTSGGGGGTEAVFKLRQGDERQWRNLRLRVIRVNDPNRTQRGGGGGGQAVRRHEGTVEFMMDNGIQTEQRNMQELQTEYVDDYRITVEEVVAAGGNTGDGSARIRISYVPQAQRNQAGALQDQMGALQQANPQQDLEEFGISINDFGALNAIIIRYTDPSVYKQVMDLITQLDKPVNQVSIETKFVEVNETRAKEFSADFNLAGLGRDASGKTRNLAWDTNRFNSRFAQDSDEFRDIFTAPIENPLAANLMKGTTVLNAVIGNQDPLLNFTLRFLESEGVLNLVNGPKVTAMDGMEAQFRIEMYINAQGANTNVGNNNSGTVLNPLQSLPQNLYLSDPDSGGGSQGMVNAVVLRVTPEITSKDSILLNDLAAELYDFEGWLGEVFQPTVQQQNNNQQNAQAFTIITPPVASVNMNQQLVLKRKKVETNARVSNGGTIILGGWTGERSEELTSGIPVLRNMPYLGKLLFSRNQRSATRTTLLIFLTCNLIE